MIDKLLKFENENQIVKETINDRCFVVYLLKYEQLPYNALLNLGKRNN